MGLYQPADVYSRDCPALLVGVLEDGPRRFSEIRDAMGITSKLLTQTLRTLERDRDR